MQRARLWFLVGLLPAAVKALAGEPSSSTEVAELLREMRQEMAATAARNDARMSAMQAEIEALKSANGTEARHAPPHGTGSHGAGALGGGSHAADAHGGGSHSADAHGDGSPGGDTTAASRFLAQMLSFNKAYLNSSNCYYFTAHGDRHCYNEAANKKARSTRRGVHSRRLPKMWARNEHQLLLYTGAMQATPENTDNTLVDVMRWNASGSRQKLCDGGRYGYWFFVTPGTSIKVQIGRSLRLASREDAGILLSNDSSRTDRNDTGWCDSARKMGYDSIQIVTEGAYYVKHASKRKRRQTELVICSLPNGPSTCYVLLKISRMCSGHPLLRQKFHAV